MMRLVRVAVPILVGLPVSVSDTAGADPGRPPSGPGPVALAEPSGPFLVGRSRLHLTDRSRVDPWVPAAGHRELMVSVW